MVFLNLGTAEPGHFERSSQSPTAAVVTWFLEGRSRSHVATPMGELTARSARGPFGLRGVSASEACAHNAQQRKTLKSFVFSFGSSRWSCSGSETASSPPVQRHRLQPRHGFYRGHPGLDARVPDGSARR